MMLFALLSFGCLSMNSRLTFLHTIVTQCHQDLPCLVLQASMQGGLSVYIPDCLHDQLDLLNMLRMPAMYGSG